MRPVSLLFFLSLAIAACSSSSSDGGTPSTDKPQPPAPPGESKESKDKPKDPTTNLVVGIDSEDFSHEGFRFATLDITATVDGVVAASETLDSAKGPMFPHELHLAAPASNPEAPVVVTLVGHGDGVQNDDSGMPPLIKRTATAKLVKGATKLLFMFLEVRCNTEQLAGGSGVSGPICSKPGETCIGGTCRSDVVATLPDFHADWATNPPSDCGTGTPELVVGKGEHAYAPLADGDTVEVEEGPQCGHHVWLALDMKNLAQFGTTTTLTASQPGSSITVPATALPYAYSANAGTCELAGVRFQLDLGTKIDEWLGKPMDIEVNAADRAGHTKKATRHVNVAATFTKGPRPCP
jgi:hypothetical protein